MKMLIAAALIMAGVTAPVLAEGAMAPMSGDMANTMMTPNDMLASCLKHAGMLADTAAQDAGKKTCNDAFTLAMGGDAMGSAPMSGDAMAPMSGDAMAPMAADGMAPAQ